jgi:hypothetical protein
MCEKVLMRMCADLAGMDSNTVVNWYSLADMSPADSKMLAEELGRRIEDSQWVDLTVALAGTPSLVLPICSQLEQKKKFTTQVTYIHIFMHLPIAELCTTMNPHPSRPLSLN